MAEHVQISVADDGPGIPVDKRNNVFDPFFSQRAGGIGLGLAIVRQIIYAHFGEIFVQEGSQRGAEFIIRLPYLNNNQATLNSTQNE